jgi:membrane protease YdiL (CAAX protease family)
MHNNSSWPGAIGRLLLVFTPAVLFLVAAWQTGVDVLGPVGTLSSLGAAGLVLRLHGKSWGELGLRRPRSWPLTVARAAALAAALHVVIGLTSTVVSRLTGEAPDITKADVLRGNLPALLIGLMVVWTSAAFGEELLFRGYLMNEVAGTLGGGAGGWVVGLVVSAVLFGLGHAYQGVTGVIVTAVVGLFFGAAYLAARRQLWVPVLTHGLYDTSAFAIIYMNWDLSLGSRS